MRPVRMPDLPPSPTCVQWMAVVRKQADLGGWGVVSVLPMLESTALCEQLGG